MAGFLGGTWGDAAIPCCHCLPRQVTGGLWTTLGHTLPAGDPVAAALTAGVVCGYPVVGSCGHGYQMTTGQHSRPAPLQGGSRLALAWSKAMAHGLRWARKVLTHTCGVALQHGQLLPSSSIPNLHEALVCAYCDEVPLG